MRGSSTLLQYLVALVPGISGVQCAETIHREAASTRRAAFAPPLPSPQLDPTLITHDGRLGGVRAIGRGGTPPSGGALSMLASPISLDSLYLRLSSAAPTSFLPTILASYDDNIPQYQAANAFQDQVALSDLTSDPALQGAFAAAAVAVVVLFAAKAVVGQVDEAVEGVALDFDRVMRLKYPEKWGEFATGTSDGDDDEVSEADRIQRVVEEMERLSEEDPKFVERVMRDIERMKR